MVRTSHASAPSSVSTSDYLHALGQVFQQLRNDRTVTDIAKQTRGVLSRSTIHRLEQGAVEVTLRSQVELASFYGLTLAALHRRAWEAIGVTFDSPSVGTLALNLSKEDRDAVLKVLTRNKTGPSPS